MFLYLQSICKTMMNYIQKTLIAHLFGFLALILTHILWSISAYGSASGGDTGLIIFWAALFLVIFYVIFVLLPKKTIEKLVQKSNLFLFSFGFAIYSLIGFIILIGWIFLSSTFNGVFLDAFFYGLTFGIVFHKITNQNKSFEGKDFILLFSIPIITFLIYIFILPKMFPTFAFKIVPKEAKEQILKETLSKFKKGDDFNDLKKALPGYFNNTSCNFSTSAMMANFQYSLVIENCKITKIQYGPRKNNNGITEMVIEQAIDEK